MKEKFADDADSKKNLMILLKRSELLSDISGDTIFTDNDKKNLKDLIEDLRQLYEIPAEFDMEDGKKS